MADTAKLAKLFSGPNRDLKVVDTSADMAFYGADQCREFAPSPGIVLLPGSADEVVRIVRLCCENGLALVPSGGRTGYSGGATATAGEVVLSLSRLNRFLNIRPIDRVLRCEAGVTTESVHAKAAEAGLYYPVDLASKGSCQIGGNVATNAGGIRVIRYGNTRNWVLSLKVVTGSGEVLELNGDLIKNQSGYDLRHFFIGSEGTLGIVLEASLLLTSPPGETAFALCAVSDGAAGLEAMRSVRDAGLTINVFEYFERSAINLAMRHRSRPDPFPAPHSAYLAIEVDVSGHAAKSLFEDTLADCLANGTLRDVLIAQSSRQAAELMSYRENISETLAKHEQPHKNDISVPLSRIPQFIAEIRSIYSQRFPDLELVLFGHIGDGNLHLNTLIPPGREASKLAELIKEVDLSCFALVQSLGGSISAEHGVGLLKRDLLHFTRAKPEIEIMRQLKQAFDPAGIMNPGKVFHTR